ncbi:sulfatase family protein [Murimonas intestini]|uniref:Arylsulfatase A-like enzyme n=1 Tax=Murimonas intestini TaxID=1337051 RepID=A0AB73T5J9_9FIRM|nr:arylsulfatase [Murimonas intestini]MCR1840784.1 arylsulfatase [Murimonas intestini]MCR1865165.1 arylsulfatase [Murimonas intestini]MCR1883124.1 arylsulfatase [Murimonas intestini]
MTDQSRKKPNVIYILADDMGYGDISAFNENCPFKTPNLDGMCENGMRFTDAHATSAVCTPSRYGILTGRYNWRSRLKSSVIGGYSEPLIEEGRKTVAHLFKEEGYRTAIVGKWHLGMSFAKTDDFYEKPDFDACTGVDYSAPVSFSPITNGFDYYYGISGSLDMPPYIYIENDRFTALPDHISKGEGKGFWREGPTAPGFIHENVLDELTDKACEKIEEYKDAPFFLYFPMPAPHTPILPSKSFQGKSGTNEYGDFVLHCDDVVGRIVKKLKDEGIYEDTILIYTSDNGCSPMADFRELKEHGHNPSYVFRGTKADIYEGGHRIPLIIQWPAMIRKGAVCTELVCLCDLMATMAEYFGRCLPDNMGEDSVSSLPLWLEQGHGGVREDLVHQSIDGSLSIRKGSFKLEMCPGSGGWSDPVPGKEDKSLPRFQLYNLENDIGEKVNVIREYPEIAKQLRDILKGYVENGRSTPGSRQSNNGQRIWETIAWLDEDDDSLELYSRE